MDAYPQWWRAAAKHLGYALDFDRRRGFGVTPALLHTRIAAELVDFLETRKGVAHAVRHRATEYSLYWLYLLKNYASCDLYRDEGPRLFGNPAWKASDVEPGGVRAFVDRQFRSGNDYFFSLLQSSTGIADKGVLEYIRAKIREGAPTNDRAAEPIAREG
jgi:hypothetical protein